MMGRLLGLALALAAGTTLSHAQTTAPSMAGFTGKWTITDVVGYADTSGGVPEARRLLGMVMTISPKGMSFDKQRCVPKSGFAVAEVESAAKLKELYDLPLLDAGLQPKTQLLDSSNCPVVFRVDEYRVLFGWNGVVVRAFRQK